jgi:hypothetical protein
MFTLSCNIKTSDRAGGLHKQALPYIKVSCLFDRVCEHRQAANPEDVKISILVSPVYFENFDMSFLLLGIAYLIWKG